MKPVQTIKNAGVYILLLAILLQATPKKYLHDALTHHHDEILPASDSGTALLANYHFHCGFVLDAAVTPFVPISAVAEITVSFYTPFIAGQLPRYVFINSNVHHLLRAPPAV